ncbi:MAG: hypothetical protein AB9Q23_12810 [Candidatus Reddybacter sp.]
MNKKVLKNIIKWLWVIAILGFIIFYAVNKKNLITQTFSMLPIDFLLVAAALIFAGKLCLVTNMSAAARHFSIPIGWRDCYYIYNLTQLAKYIPGSIWQFVGRFSILSDRGIEKYTIRNSIITEHLWILLSASILAAMLSLTTILGFFEAKFSNYNQEHIYTWGLATLFLTLSIAIFYLFCNWRLASRVLRIIPPLSIIPILALTWILLGASLWVTIEPFVVTKPSILYVIGMYCFGYVMGFIAPFAPAGIGIREAVLTFSLTPFMDIDVAILLSAVNRVIYFVVEILLAISCLYKTKGTINE